MSKDGSVEMGWADGEYRFRLAIGHLRELEDKRGCSAIEVMDRLQARKWFVDDVREVIRLGLIGGGQTPDMARVLTKRYVDERPLLENCMQALIILAAALAGSPDDDGDDADEGKSTAEATATSPAG